MGYQSVLSIRQGVPQGFLDAEPGALADLLGGPTLFHVPGRSPDPLFVSVMLHGNEPAGLRALQGLLTSYRSVGLPRALSVFIGNVEAARYGKRFLPGQPDYNRIWCPGRGAEHEMTQQVLDEMRRFELFAAIDVHNNTGPNPFYALVAQDSLPHLQLARGFSNIVVYATYPDSTCTVAFSRLCPAVTLEAGMPADRAGVEQARRFIDQCLHLEALPLEPLTNADLYQTVAVVKVSNECTYGFHGEDSVDLEFAEHLEQLNFTELAPGTELATMRNGCSSCLRVWNNHGVDVGQHYLHVDKHGVVKTARRVMPAMLTLDREIIRMDCLCYLMERKQSGDDSRHAVAEGSQ